MVIRQRDVWLADFGDPLGSRPTNVRLFAVLQADFINRTRIGTVFGVAVTSNLALAEPAGSVVLEHIHHLSDESLDAIPRAMLLVMGAN